jgi:tetratricopeptide (TPR) repeat protein
MLALVLMRKGMFAESLAEGEKALTFSGRSARCLACIGGFYATSGGKQEAEKIIKELHELSKHKHLDSYVLAWVHANLRDTESALTQLERADVKQSSYLAAIKVDAALEALRCDLRFRDLQYRIGLR